MRHGSILLPFMLSMLFGVACDDGKGAAGTPSGTSASTTAASNAPASTGSAATSKGGGLEKGSVAALRDKASKVMAALKKGDAEAAGAFCLGKHRESFQKYIAETIEKKDQSRWKNYQAYNGTLGEIRIKENRAWVKYGEDGNMVDLLLFTKKDGAWSLHDIPSKPKKQFDSYGEVAPAP